MQNGVLDLGTIEPGGTPLYKQIADRLTDLILSTVLHPHLSAKRSCNRGSQAQV